MSMSEKGRKLRRAITLLGRAMGQESNLPAKMTHQCGSLISMGAGTAMGGDGCLYSGSRRQCGSAS